LLTVISIASVVAVYAVLIGTYPGGDVTIGGGASGTVTYSTDQSTWTDTLSPADVDEAWYSKINIDGGQYAGTSVTITWQLQRKTGDTTWSDLGLATTTTMSLGDSAQDVYATTDGQSSGNRNWSLDITQQGTYRVLVTVNSA
jgi:hypothetical protein